MQIDRVQADKAFAFLGFTLSFLFLLAVVARSRYSARRTCLIGTERRAA